MKNPSRPITPPVFSEDDIRAYAEHLYEQSGRIPNRDVDNWLEAKACLEVNVPRQESHVRLHRHRERQHRTGTVHHGFTMPPSDTSLWIEMSSCKEGAAGPPPYENEERNVPGPSEPPGG